MNRLKQKKDKDVPKPKHFYYFILRNFAILIMIILVMAFLLSNFYNNLPEMTRHVPISKDIEKQEDYLESENYDMLKFPSSIGKKGYFEVLDKDAKVIYCSRESEKNTYTKTSLSYIIDLDKDTYSMAIPFTDDYGTGYVLVKLSTQDLDKDEPKQLLQGIAVINGKREIKYSNLAFADDHISSKELDYLLETSGDSSRNNTILQKYRFKTADGEVRYLLIHSPIDNPAGAKLARNWEIASLMLFIALVIIAILTVAFMIVRRIKRPLQKLDTALTGLASGNRAKIIEEDSPLELHQVIRTFNAMEEKLEASDVEKQELEDQRRKMLADISHDLKTPITVIQGYINAMQDGLIPPSEQQKYLKIMNEKAEIMSNLISGFSDYSRMEHPEYQFTLERGDLSEYIREYMAERYDELSLSGYDLDVNVPEKRVMVDFDEKELRRVFDNILSNALKYTPSGTTIFVGLETEADGIIRGKDEHKKPTVYKGEIARLWIGDNGPGIPEELKAHIFDPFVIADNSRKSGRGTGLGLSIARKIVSGHGGRIHVLNHQETEKLFQKWGRHETGTSTSTSTIYEIILPMSQM